MITILSSNLSLVNLDKLNKVVIPSYDLFFREIWNHFSKYYQGYGEDDYRSIFFGTYVESLLWTIYQLENFSNNAPNLSIRPRFTSLKESSRVQILAQFDTINRKTFVMDTMSLVEDFLNSICIEIFGKQFRDYKLLLMN